MENDPVLEEDPHVGVEQFVDDSDLPSEAVVAHVLESDSPMAVQSTAEGDLVSAAHAESLEEDTMEERSRSEEATASSSSSAGASGRNEAEELGVGKRKRRPNTLYNSVNFWRHHDNDNVETENYS
jgi:hypothetical protein